MKKTYRNQPSSSPRLGGILWLALAMGILIFSSAVPARAAASATLTVGSVSGNPGSPVGVTVSLAPGASLITSLQFDLGFASPLTYVSAASGPASTAAGKMVSGSGTAGGMRLVVMGLNQTAIGAGDVATVQLNIAANAPGGTVAVTISNIVASDGNAQPVSVLGAPGAVTINGSALAAPANLSPANGSTGVSLHPTLSWSAVSGATSYQVYFGTSNSPSLAGNTTGTNYPPPTLNNNTVYYWRVVAQRGSESASSATISFTTEAASDTTPPVISSVSAGSIQPSGATITWSTNEASDSRVEYGTSLTFGNTTALDPAMVTNHSQAVTGLTAGTLYYYRVKSRDAAGNLSTSSAYNFTTVASAPQAPTNLSPADGATGIAQTVTLSWSGATGASSYDVYFGTEVIPTYAANVTGTSYKPSALAPGKYFWRVVAKNSFGNSSSATLSFTVANVPLTAPLNLLPADGTTGVAQNVTLSWSPVSAAEAYDVYFGTSEAPPLAVTTSETSCKLPTLEIQTKYYWRVAAKKGSESASSATISFTTGDGAAPEAPAGLNPAGTIVSLTPVLTWSASKNAAAYDVYLGSSNPPGLIGTTAATQFASGRLAENVTYYWRVVAKNSVGSKSSATVTFRIERRLTAVLPRLAGTRGRSLTLDTAEYTGIAIANLGTTDAVLQLTAVAQDGSMIAGAGITNPAAMTLKPGQQVPILDTQVFGDALAGTNKVAWMEVESSSEKIASYFMEFNSALTKLDGAAISNLAFTSMVLPDLETRGTTQISIANASGAPARIKFDVIDSDGFPLRSEIRQVNASGSLTESSTTLFPGLQVKSSQYVRISSDQPVVLVEFLRQTTGDTKSIGGIDASRGNREIYAPQYAIGGGWASTVSIVNLDSIAGIVSVRFVGNDGGQIGMTRAVELNASGKIFISGADFFGDLGPGLHQGYLEIFSNGPRLAGDVMFGDPAETSFAAALALVSELQTSVVFSHVASSDLFYTGVSLLNPNPAGAYATIEVHSADGTRLYTIQEYIRAHGRISKLLTEYFPEMADKSQTSGYIRVISDRGIAAYALFGTPSALAALPAQPAP